MSRYLVIVSRDRPVLFATLAIAYGQEGDTELRFDRRQGLPWTGRGVRPDRRSRSPRDRDLQAHGFLAIPRPKSSPCGAESIVSAGTQWRRPCGPRGIALEGTVSV